VYYCSYSGVFVKFTGQLLERSFYIVFHFAVCFNLHALLECQDFNLDSMPSGFAPWTVIDVGH